MSSSKTSGPRQVPPPPNARTASSYTRFIPREELRNFSNWQPDNFASNERGATKPPVPAEPEVDLAARDSQREEAVRAQVQAARQGGYEDGYRDGLVALDNFKQSFARQTSAQIGALVISFDREFEALEQQLAASVARIAVRLARQVVRSEVSAHPELVARVAQEAIGAVLASAHAVAVHVHPDDLPLVAEGAADALAARTARLVADPSIERGGCRIDSDVGSVDARIETRWKNASETLVADTPWTAT